MAGMSMAGGLMGAMGAQTQGASQAAAQEFNAEIAGRNAGLAREAAAHDASIQERQARMHLGSIRAAYGASGVTVAGSPLDVLEMSARHAEQDRQQIIYKGELKALGYEDTRTLNLYSADSAKKAADWGTASSLLTGFPGGFKLSTLGKTGTSAGAPERPTLS
jgi:hypothetical protein